MGCDTPIAIMSADSVGDEVPIAIQANEPTPSGSCAPPVPLQVDGSAFLGRSMSFPEADLSQDRVFALDFVAGGTNLLDLLRPA